MTSPVVLASSVKARRLHLRMTPDDVRAAGGPSSSILSKIENAREDDYLDSTLMKLDSALRLAPGACAAALREGIEFSPQGASAVVAAPSIQQLRRDVQTLTRALMSTLELIDRVLEGLDPSSSPEPGAS